MNRLLLVVDVQNDFINEHTKDTLIKIKELVEQAETAGFSQDIRHHGH